MLEVEVAEDSVVIRGCVPCYYLKQLALQGALDVLGFSRTARVDLKVHVPGAAMSGGNF
jgi:hypothetical protein